MSGAGINVAYLAGIVDAVLDIAAHQINDRLLDDSQWQHEPLSCFYRYSESVIQAVINAWSGLPRAVPPEYQYR